MKEQEENSMSTREKAMNILSFMTEEQLQGFIMMFSSLVDTPNMETQKVIEDIENGRNLSKLFNSVEELMEDLNVDD